MAKIEHKIIFTGQHKDIVDSFFDLKIEIPENKKFNRLDQMMTQNNVNPTNLDSAREKNDEVRKNRDWESMKGSVIPED